MPDNQRWRGQARVKNPDEREEYRLIGLLTDRDITVRAVAEGLSPMETGAQQVMTSEVEYIFDDYPVEEAARYMSELQVRRLTVVDRDHRLVGIVSLGDLALSEQQSAGAALNSISQTGVGPYLTFILS
ncbi:inosine-5-monophosphate dehydrogenase [Methylophilus sp. TWE2]|nr:inosine-5-monophosphate dehydrogenase [Methylophilus sp. TWE2]